MALGRVVISFITLIVLNSISANAQVLFDGYYQVYQGDQLIGFVAQKYEYNIKSKNYESAYLIRLKTAQLDSVEGLKASCKDDFTPISFQYTFKEGKTVKTIDANFESNPKKGDSVKLTTSNGKSKTVTEKKLPPNTFLSTFLAYFMLKKGFKTGVKYVYKAIAEEDASVYNGEAFIKSVETVSGVESFRILNVFKNIQFLSFVTGKAEVLSTTSPMQNISTKLVPSASLATAQFPIPTEPLKVLFGSIPKGEQNVLFELSKQTPKAAMPKPALTEPKKGSGGPVDSNKVTGASLPPSEAKNPEEQ